MLHHSLLHMLKARPISTQISRISSYVKRSIFTDYTNLGVCVCVCVCNRNTVGTMLSAESPLTRTTSPVTVICVLVLCRVKQQRTKDEE